PSISTLFSYTTLFRSVQQLPTQSYYYWLNMLNRFTHIFTPASPLRSFEFGVLFDTVDAANNSAGGQRMISICSRVRSSFHQLSKDRKSTRLNSSHVSI